MNSSCKTCDQYLQCVKFNKKISVDQAQVINELNIKNKNEQEIVKKLLNKVDILTKSNNELNDRLKVEIEKNEKNNVFENKFNKLESELQNIRLDNNNQTNNCNNSRINVMNTDEVNDDGNTWKDLKLKLQKCEEDNEELLKNIEIKNNYIKTLNKKGKKKEGQNNQDILIENKKLILLNEELNCTLNNIKKECKTCQDLKEQNQELKKANMMYQMEIKALKRKASDLDRELKDINIFNTKLQNENIKLSTQNDKYKELNPGKVEEMTRTVERLKQLISNDTRQRKMEINKTCEICKVTANLIFDCFKGNESYRAINSMSRKLLEAYKQAKFTLLKHVQNNLITHMLTIEGESDLLKSIEEIIDRDKSQKISPKKVIPNETDEGESSPSYMTVDSNYDTKVNDFSGYDTDHEMDNRIGDRKKRVVLSKPSKTYQTSSTKTSIKDGNSNPQETIEIIPLEEIFPEDSLKYRQETSVNQNNSEVQKIRTSSKKMSVTPDGPSCRTLHYDSSKNEDEKMNIDKDVSVEMNSDNNDNKQGEELSIPINALKIPESINNMDEFPESCRGAEYISTPLCIDNDIEIIGTYMQKLSTATCIPIHLIKTEDSNENKNFSTVSKVQSPLKSDIIDCELSINENPLNLSFKPNPFLTKAEVEEFDCEIDFPLNLCIKNSNKFHQSKHSEITSTPIQKLHDHYYINNPREELNCKLFSSPSIDFQNFHNQINSSIANSSIGVSKRANSVVEIAKHDQTAAVKRSGMKPIIESDLYQCDTINNNNNGNLLENIGKSIVKRKIIYDKNREMCSKKPRLESDKDQYSIEKPQEINISNLQRVTNEINEKCIRRYQEMVEFTNRNSILPTLSFQINQSKTNKTPVSNSLLKKSNEMITETPNPAEKSVESFISPNLNIDNFNQSEANKNSVSNPLLKKSNEMITETPNPTERPAESKIPPTVSDTMEKSGKSSVQLENASISLDYREPLNNNRVNEVFIENLFQELIHQQSPKDFLPIIRQRIIMETETQAKRFIDSFLEFFLQHKYKSFNRKLAADIAYYMILSLYSQCQQPIYDYWYSALLAAFRSQGIIPVLLMANLALLVFLQRSDQLIGFLVDLIRLPNVRLLSVIRWISRPADLFPAPLAATHPLVIHLIKRIVVFEYSVAMSNSEARKSFINIPLDSQRFWLDGHTTETVLQIDDVTPIVQLANQISRQYKSQNSNLKLDNLDEDIKLKYVVNK